MSIKDYSAFKQIMITLMLLNMKENVMLRRVDKEGVFIYISIKDSHTNIHVGKIYIVYFIPSSLEFIQYGGQLLPLHR